MIPRQCQHGMGKGFRIAWGDKETVYALRNHLGYAAHICSYKGQTSGHGFDKSQAKAFPELRR